MLEIFQTVAETKGLPGLVLNLVRRPGEVSREFVEGKRKSWFPPFSFLILTVGISSLLLGETRIISTSQKQFLIHSLGQIMDEHANVIIFLNVPLLALFNWLLFRRSRYNYAEHLVFAAYTSGMKSIFFSLLVVPVAFAFPGKYGVVIVFYLVSWILYFSWADKQFIGSPPRGTRIKGLLVPILTQLSTIFFVLSLVFMLKGKELIRAVREKNHANVDSTHVENQLK